MQHRPHRPAIFPTHHHQEPLLPFAQQQLANHGFRLTPAGLQRATATFALVLLLFVARTYHWHYGAAQRRALSSCPARLAALGLDLNAASLEGRHFATTGPVISWPDALARRALYEAMGSDMRQHGLRLGGLITQGLRQDELFERVPARSKWRRPTLRPILRHLEVPVRAVVLPLLDGEAAVQIHSTVRRALQELLSDDSVYFQDAALLHATLFHASSHTAPVPATPEQVRQEQAAVARVAGRSCPIRAVLDRVVATSSGVVVACWQVLPGSAEPAALRAALSSALPNAPPPDKQAVREPAILHTTVARLLAPATRPPQGHGAAAGGGGTREEWSDLLLQRALMELVEDMTDELCGLVASFDEVWHVEESHLLALGLGGRYQKRTAELRCPSAPGGGDGGGTRPRPRR